MATRHGGKVAHSERAGAVKAPRDAAGGIATTPTSPAPNAARERMDEARSTSPSSCSDTPISVSSCAARTTSAPPFAPSCARCRSPSSARARPLSDMTRACRNIARIASTNGLSLATDCCSARSCASSATSGSGSISAASLRIDGRARSLQNSLSSNIADSVASRCCATPDLYSRSTMATAVLITRGTRSYTTNKPFSLLSGCEIPW
mmetsp:Transcript_7427/g.22569  ORF Transcript_7427/g.22569 Transcript_7427/m.22569 type:complete len:207 (+) Transcript_7427:82-702(+)